MTVVFTTGDFWIEDLVTVLTLTDAAGQVNSTLQNLSKPGRFVGGFITATTSADNDNTQAVGLAELRTTGTIAYGSAIAQLRVRATKQAGTAGNTNVTYHMTVFLRK